MVKFKNTHDSCLKLSLGDPFWMDRLPQDDVSGVRRAALDVALDVVLHLPVPTVPSLRGRVAAMSQTGKELSCLQNWKLKCNQFLINLRFKELV